jgi:hypothetical protein
VLRIWPVTKRGCGEHSPTMGRTLGHENGQCNMDLEAVENRGALRHFI